MASGRRGKPDRKEFADAVHKLCEDLTIQMAYDAEGMTKLVRLTVAGAKTADEARAAANASGPLRALSLPFPACGAGCSE